MTHLFINGAGASAGGGLTYLRNAIPHFSTLGCRMTIAANDHCCRELNALPQTDFVEMHTQTTGARFWREQRTLPQIVKQSGAEVLLSTGNFALRNSPIPQILLSRNSLYTSSDFFVDLISRHEYRLWLQTRIRSAFAKASVAWADQTVAPSHAFASELNHWTKRKIETVYHGFDRDAFFSSSNLSSTLNDKLLRKDDSLRLLLVSHYNYYRNFETVFRALPLLQSQIGRKVELVLTCSINSQLSKHTYSTAKAATLIRKLNLSDNIVELGTVPYGSLHYVYGACDLYVTAAYAESFAHPLVEAMASGLPVIASDLPVHREICGDAALFFHRFSSAALAQTAVEALNGKTTGMVDRGKSRASTFSWKHHAEEILQMADDLARAAA